MSISTIEREVFGDVLTPTERVISGLIAAAAAAAQIALVATVVLFFYVLVTFAL